MEEERGNERPCRAYHQESMLRIWFPHETLPSASYSGVIKEKSNRADSISV
jgi:hypothetical protein